MASQSPPGGSIIAISSISALVGGGEQTHYTPTKAGIKSGPFFARAFLLSDFTDWLAVVCGSAGLMESCAIALGPKGIRCNSILPGSSLLRPPCAQVAETASFPTAGTIATAINTEDLADPAKNAAMSARTCLGRLGVREYCRQGDLSASGALTHFVRPRQRTTLPAPPSSLRRICRATRPEAACSSTVACLSTCSRCMSPPSRPQARDGYMRFYRILRDQHGTVPDWSASTSGDAGN